MGTGQAFVKWIKPAGCAIFLIFGIIFTISLFTGRGTPVEGYEPPEDSEYYSRNPDDFAEELRENLLPKLQADSASVTVEDGSVTVRADPDDLRAIKLAVIYYYDESMVTFVEVEE